MARPRVFVSSTFYDLKQVRSTLDSFIREFGFEPVLNEHGAIPYSAQESPEKGAYREVDLCDILVSIVGGRYGTPSDDGAYSISQRELKRAHEKGKQIYIFVERSVQTNFELYLVNRGNSEIQYTAGSVPIFKFIDEVKTLPQNNAIETFELASDITSYLREQWAGLFHRLLQESIRTKDIESELDFKSATNTLQQLVKYLTEERQNSNETIKDILLSSHPAFSEVQRRLGIKHRIFFSNKKELEQLMQAYGFEEEYNPFADEVDEGEILYMWSKGSGRNTVTVSVARGVFDSSDNLVPKRQDQWDSKRIVVSGATVPPSADDFDPFADE